MRLAWWGVIAIGAILVVAGTYTIMASQDAIDYVNSCGKPVSCGTAKNPAPQSFLTSDLTTLLQEAQLAWVVGIGALGLGLVSVTYGVYLYLGRAGSTAVQAGVAPR